MAINIQSFQPQGDAGFMATVCWGHYQKWLTEGALTAREKRAIENRKKFDGKKILK
jgi:hypothetical protein